ncbi:MAG: maltose alpha-D-glucosyltransferase, partial [Elusimicrobia bacterium]|nr:maltose alpha-D-glucosyltransferase [Elusimicrobiota bacterium]MBD3412438.1 maltose alpha-D-glucosyltransferase [Elusimicrobiota bacterium]
FQDTDGDGIGDFKGLTQRLDYLESLGITAIWLLPFFPSPLKDDGYDIADYFNIHLDYGTLKDFKEFLHVAHAKGIRVIIELVINHTSIEHSWFRRARVSPKKSSHRNFYVWSDHPDKYKDARIIFTDFETSNWQWDPIAKSYYWHRFYSHQPDLNFDNTAVQKQVFKVLDYWFSMGVDGLRLDAVPYLFEREGTNCENLPETHNFLKKLRAHVDKKFTNKMLLAEANQWPEDAYQYFGNGDECHMAFHFPLMPRMFMALQMEDNFPIVDILKTTPSIPDPCQWAMFLRNHDELTLEMVTDEERDYMYHVYAKDPRAKINAGIRRRLAPLMLNNRRKIELLNILLFSLPGTPVLYYGDEIGMGDNYYLGDRNGVRTPMQWSSDRNAGFSKANPQQLYLPIISEPEYHYEAINVENQERNLSSLLWWMKRVIGIRKKFKSFSRGSFIPVSSDNSKILAFVRHYEDETMLVCANLSRFTQVARLDLADFSGKKPEEIFSQNRLPTIHKTPYILTFGPYTHYWLLLIKEKKTLHADGKSKSLNLRFNQNWEELLKGKNRSVLEEKILPGYAPQCRWFGSKSKSIRKVRIIDDIRLSFQGEQFHLLFLAFDYKDGSPESYILPVSYASSHKAKEIAEGKSHSIIAHVISDSSEEGIIYESFLDEKFSAMLLQSLIKRKNSKGSSGELVFIQGKQCKKICSGDDMTPRPIKAEQSNTSICYDKKCILKLYRKIAEGTSPELETIRYLTDKAGYKNIPAYAGTIEYHIRKKPPYTIGLFQEYIEHEGDAWTLSLDSVAQYYERVLSHKHELPETPVEPLDLFDETKELPDYMNNLIGSIYPNLAALLGKRTAEMHTALGSKSAIPDFEPEPFSLLFQRSIYQSIRTLVHRTFQEAYRITAKAPPELRSDIAMIIESEDEILKRFDPLMKRKCSVDKIRIHGDYHLGQVLYTGKDFII